MTDIKTADKKLNKLKPRAVPTYTALMVLAIVTAIALLVSGLAVQRSSRATETICMKAQLDQELLVDIFNRLTAPRELGPTAAPERVADQDAQNAKAAQYRKEAIGKLQVLECEGLSDFVAPDPEPVRVPDPLPGVIGATGEEGPPGLTGPTGPVGPAGEDGRDGRDGIDGRNGQDGRDGPQGEPGPQGEKGDKGDQGEPAPTTTSTTSTSTTTTSTTTTTTTSTTTTTCVVCVP